MEIISNKAKGVSPSLTLEITAKAKAMKADGISVISFGAGEPDFNTPEYIINAAKDALDKGYTKYTAVSGIKELKDACCEKFLKDNGLVYTPEQIVISSGAKASIFHVLSAIINDGDEVLIPSPYWLTYPEVVKLVGGKCVILQTLRENNYKVSPDRILNAITDRTKCLILNSPNNPSGAVYTESELRKIAEIVEKTGIYVISDEIYENLVYGDEKHFSIAQTSEFLKAHTIIVNGVSKSYSMTGWRIGYIAAPLEIAKAVSAIQGHTTSNANSIAQYASAAALKGGEHFINSMRNEFDDRRKYMFDRLKNIRAFKLNEPKGAFYAFIDISSLYGKKSDGEIIDGSLKFSKLLLKYGVAVIPGIAFGDDNCIRLSYAISKSDIKEGLDRIENFINKLN